MAIPFSSGGGNPTTYVTPSESHTGKEGYLVDLAAGVATISSDALVPAKGVILAGAATTDGKDQIGILGGLAVPVPLRAGGAIAAYAEVQQDDDGRVITDSGSGDRLIVGVALEAATEGDLFFSVARQPVLRT